MTIHIKLIYLDDTINFSLEYAVMTGRPQRKWTKHSCTTIMCRSILKSKLRFLKMRIYPYLSENHDLLKRKWQLHLSYRVELYRTSYCRCRRQSHVNGGLKNSYLKSSNLLISYILKPAPTIWPLQEWNYLSTIFTVQSLLSATLISYVKIEMKFSSDEDLPRTWDNECAITSNESYLRVLMKIILKIFNEYSFKTFLVPFV